MVLYAIVLVYSLIPTTAALTSTAMVFCSLNTSLAQAEPTSTRLPSAVFAARAELDVIVEIRQKYCVNKSFRQKKEAIDFETVKISRELHHWNSIKTRNIDPFDLNQFTAVSQLFTNV